MPTLTFLESSSPDGTANATLVETTVTEDEVMTEDGILKLIIVSFTLTTSDDETYIHMFQFFTDFDSDEAWGEYIDTITRAAGFFSIVYHVKRSGAVMCEFTNLCLEDKRCAAAA